MYLYIKDNEIKQFDYRTSKIGYIEALLDLLQIDTTDFYEIVYDIYGTLKSPYKVNKNEVVEYFIKKVKYNCACYKDDRMIKQKFIDSNNEQLWESFIKEWK